MSRAQLGKLLLLSVVAVMVLAILPDVAWAAPGGIVKAVAKSRWAQIVFGLMILIFLPWVISFLYQRAKQIRKTRKDLTALAMQHPQYRWTDLNVRFRQVFGWVWSAWTQQKMEVASEFTTHWFWQNQQLVLEDYARRGVENICHVVKITGITPLYVEHRAEDNGEGSRVVVSIEAKVVDYLQDRTGKVVQGDKKEGELDTVWTFKWVNGSWVLDLIEESATEFDYLKMPNSVAAPQGATARSGSGA